MDGNGKRRKNTDQSQFPVAGILYVSTLGVSNNNLAAFHSCVPWTEAMVLCMLSSRTGRRIRIKGALSIVLHDTFVFPCYDEVKISIQSGKTRISNAVMQDMTTFFRLEQTKIAHTHTRTYAMFLNLTLCQDVLKNTSLPARLHIQ